MSAPFDLHLHTLHSDGRDSPREIFQFAHEAKLKLIAITDHDTVAGYAEAREAALEVGIMVLSGVEVTTRFANHALHILGYGIDTDNPNLLHVLEENRIYRRQHFLLHFDSLNRVFRQQGKPELNRESYIRSQGLYFSKPGLARFIEQSGNALSRTEAFAYANQLPDPAPADLPPQKAIAVLHGAGGRAVVAHPFADRLSLKEIFPAGEAQLDALQSLRDQGLDGLEVYQSGHSHADTQRALDIARKLGLLVTGGTDWHGSFERHGQQRAELPWEGYAKQVGDLQIDRAASEQLVQTWRKIFRQIIF